MWRVCAGVCAHSRMLVRCACACVCVCVCVCARARACVCLCLIMLVSVCGLVRALCVVEGNNSIYCIGFVCGFPLVSLSLSLSPPLPGHTNIMLSGKCVKRMPCSPGLNAQKKWVKPR